MSAMPTQIQRMTEQMKLDRDAGHGTCGTTFLSMFIARYAARSWEMVHDLGYVIDSHPCTRHEHDGPIAEYTLIHAPDDAPKQLPLAIAS